MSSQIVAKAFFPFRQDPMGFHLSGCGDPASKSRSTTSTIFKKMLNFKHCNIYIGQHSTKCPGRFDDYASRLSLVFDPSSKAHCLA